MNTCLPIVKSWAGKFLSAALASFLTILVTIGDVPDGAGWKGIAIAGLIAVIPVIRNFLDSSYPGYGRGKNGLG